MSIFDINSANAEKKRREDEQLRDFFDYDALPTSWTRQEKEDFRNGQGVVILGEQMLREGQLTRREFEQLKAAELDASIAKADMDTYVAMRGYARNPANGALYKAGECQISDMMARAHQKDHPDVTENAREVKAVVRKIGRYLGHRENAAGRWDDEKYGAYLRKNDLLSPELKDPKTGEPIADDKTLGVEEYVSTAWPDVYKPGDQIRQEQAESEQARLKADPAYRQRREAEREMKVDPKFIEDFRRRNVDHLGVTPQGRERLRAAQEEAMTAVRKTSAEIEQQNAKDAKLEQDIARLEQQLHQATTPHSSESLGNILGGALANANPPINQNGG